MVVALLARDLAPDQVARRLEIEHEDHRFEQAGVHPLACAGAAAIEQRQGDGQCQQISGSEIGNRDAYAHRALPGKPGDGHESAQALCDLIHSAALVVRPALTEPADAAVD